MRLIAYLRTSSTGTTNGDSLDAQEDACRDWAGASGHEIVCVKRDEGVSGGKAVDERPGLLAALITIEEGSAEGLVVHRIDRLARELHVQEAALARLWTLGDYVGGFEAVEGEIKRDDPADPHRRFLRQVLGAAAELERGLRSARLRRGRRRKAARGGYIGGPRFAPRFGYTLESGEYVPVVAEQEIIGKMRERYEGGETLETIATSLAADGRMPSGGAWSRQAVAKILRREGVELRPRGRVRQAA